MSNTTVPVQSPYDDGKYDPRSVISVKMAAVKIYRGQMVFLNGSGYADNPTNTAGEQFLGVAMNTVDNSAGAAGDLEVKVVQKGLFRFYGAQALAVTDIGAAVYASDNQTVTKTAKANFVGIVAAVDSEGVWVVLRTVNDIVTAAGAAQAAVATTGSSNSSPYGFTTAAQADAIVTLVNAMRAALIANGILKGAA